MSCFQPPGASPPSLSSASRSSLPDDGPFYAGAGPLSRSGLRCIARGGGGAIATRYTRLSQMVPDAPLMPPPAEPHAAVEEGPVNSLRADPRVANGSSLRLSVRGSLRGRAILLTGAMWARS